MHIRRFFRIHAFTRLEYTSLHPDHDDTNALPFGASLTKQFRLQTDFALKMTREFKSNNKQNQTVQRHHKAPFNNST